LTNEALKEKSYIGFFRIWETNKRVVLPTNTHLRLLITAVDVLHSWTISSFGPKIDACPGKLNQANLFIKRFGIFFGQCSEICGVNHGSMPIVLFALPSVQYHHLLMTNLEFGGMIECLNYNSRTSFTSRRSSWKLCFIYFVKNSNNYRRTKSIWPWTRF